MEFKTEIPEGRQLTDSQVLKIRGKRKMALVGGKSDTCFTGSQEECNCVPGKEDIL